MVANGTIGSPMVPLGEPVVPLALPLVPMVHALPTFPLHTNLHVRINLLDTDIDTIFYFCRILNNMEHKASISLGCDNFATSWRQRSAT